MGTWTTQLGADIPSSSDSNCVSTVSRITLRKCLSNEAVSTVSLVDEIDRAVLNSLGDSSTRATRIWICLFPLPKTTKIGPSPILSAANCPDPSWSSGYQMLKCPCCKRFTPKLLMRLCEFCAMPILLWRSLPTLPGRLVRPVYRPTTTSKIRLGSVSYRTTSHFSHWWKVHVCCHWFVRL